MDHRKPCKSFWNFLVQVISLFRTASTDNVKMHCGRLKYAASFRKIRKMPVDVEREVPLESPVPSAVVTPSDSQTDGAVTPPPDRIEEALLAAPDEDPDYGHRVSLVLSISTNTNM
jgi:hypothetical protein